MMWPASPRWLTSVAGRACSSSPWRRAAARRQPFLLLWDAGIACGLTNPKSVRRYAEAMGILEKTDRLDAGVIARFAIAKGLKPTSPPTPTQQRLNALVARLRQITDDLTANKQRRSSAMNAEMVTSIDEVISLLKRQARTLEGEIASLIDDDPLWSQLDAALRTTKGVANRTVARVLAELPEIGIYSNKAVVKLAGLAPLADDSGARAGRRHIRGGRAGIRSILFLIADIARRFDESLAAFHRKLTAAGKPKMVVSHRIGAQTARSPQRQSTRSARTICTRNLTTHVASRPVATLHHVRAGDEIRVVGQ